MKKRRWGTTTTLALAVLTWAGCDSQTKWEAYEAALEALERAAPDERAAYQKAKAAYETGLNMALAAAANKSPAAYEKTRAAYGKADAARLAHLKAALEALKQAAPNEYKAYGKAKRALKAAAPDEWKRYDAAKRRIKRLETELTLGEESDE